MNIKKSSAISTTSISRTEPVYTVINEYPTEKDLHVGMLVQAVRSTSFKKLISGNIYRIFEIRQRAHKIGLETLDGSLLRDGAQSTYTSPQFLKIVEEL